MACSTRTTNSKKYMQLNRLVPKSSTALIKILTMMEQINRNNCVYHKKTKSLERVIVSFQNLRHSKRLLRNILFRRNQGRAYCYNPELLEFYAIKKNKQTYQMSHFSQYNQSSQSPTTWCRLASQNYCNHQCSSSH